MRSIRSRLDRAVSAMELARAGCPACGGADAARLRFRLAENAPAREQPCPSCGRVPRTVTVVIGMGGDARSGREAAAGPARTPAPRAQGYGLNG